MFSGVIWYKSRFLISFCSKLSVLFWVSIRHATCLPCATVQVHIDHFSWAVCLFLSSASSGLLVPCLPLCHQQLLFAWDAFSEDSPGTETDIALLCQLAFSHLSCHQPEFVWSASRSASAPVSDSGTAFSAGSGGSLVVTRPNYWLHEDCPRVAQGTTTATFSNWLGLCQEEAGWWRRSLSWFGSLWAAEALEGAWGKVILVGFINLFHVPKDLPVVQQQTGQLCCTVFPSHCCCLCCCV